MVLCLYDQESKTLGQSVTITPVSQGGRDLVILHKAALKS
jgi:hypothetical protein